MTIWPVRDAVREAADGDYGAMITSMALRNYADAIDDCGDIEAALDKMASERHL